MTHINNNSVPGDSVKIKKEFIIYAAVAFLVVIAVAGYLLISRSAGSSLIGTQVSHSVIIQMQNIANNYTLANKVGAGLTTYGGSSNLPHKITAPPLTANGKPEILYVGGDFCPYCAITRWGLIFALMRFGTFSNLTYMESSPTDVYANSATFSFRNSNYQSSSVHFDGVETTDRLGQPLNNTNFSPLYQSIYSKYSQGVPFIDFANSSIQIGTIVSPQIIGGESWPQILASFNNTNGDIAQAIIGSANGFTAYICRSNSTLNATAVACRQSYVKEFS